jgi:hypothetical protein
VQVLMTRPSTWLRRGPRAPAPAGARREARRGAFFDEAPVQRIGIDGEAIVEAIERQRAPLDAVVVVEDALQHRARARRELGALGALQRLPAFALA